MACFLKLDVAFFCPSSTNEEIRKNKTSNQHKLKLKWPCKQILNLANSFPLLDSITCRHKPSDKHVNKSK